MRQRGHLLTSGLKVSLLRYNHPLCKSYVNTPLKVETCIPGFHITSIWNLFHLVNKVDQ